MSPAPHSKPDPQAASAALGRAGLRVKQASQLSAHEGLRDPIRGVMPSGVGMLFGDSNAGKTVISIDMALHLMTGTAWAGHLVDRLPVIYIATEAGMSAERRFVAAELAAGVALSADWFMLCEGALDLRSQATLDDLVNAAASFGGPGVMFVDTFANAYGDADENDAGDMSDTLRAAESFADRTGWTIVMVHHTGKSGATYRGSSVLRGSPNFVLEVFQAANGITTVSVNKMRDGEKRPVAVVRVEGQKIGRDGYGLDLIVPVAVASPPDRPKDGELRTAMTATERRAARLLEIVQTHARQHGGIAPENAVRSEFYASEEDGSKESFKTFFRRAVGRLVERRLIEVAPTGYRPVANEAAEQGGGTPPSCSRSAVPAESVSAEQGDRDTHPAGVCPCPDVPHADAIDVAVMPVVDDGGWPLDASGWPESPPPGSPPTVIDDWQAALHRAHRRPRMRTGDGRLPTRGG